MKRNSSLALCAVLLGGFLAGAAGPAHAQTPAIGGAQLQTWLDQKFTYAGLHHGSGCHFMNSADAAGRVLFLSCPNGWSAKLAGTARVQGEQMCTRFPVPNSPSAEECLSWHRRADGVIEQRDAAGISTTLYLLSELKR
jgi:hypothetical protein